MDTKIVLRNGSELKVNFLDLDFRGMYVEEAKKYSEAMNKINLEDDEMLVLNTQYEYTKEFIDKVFGIGEFDSLMKGKRDLALMLELVVALTNAKAEMDKTLNEMSAKVNFGNGYPA